MCHFQIIARKRVGNFSVCFLSSPKWSMNQSSPQCCDNIQDLLKFAEKVTLHTVFSKITFIPKTMSS